MKFALVGSRSTPINLFKQICINIAEQGHSMRSGAAEGADTWAEEAFFEVGNPNVEIFIPWPSFGKQGKLRQYHIIPPFTDYHRDLVNRIHPAPSRLSQGAYKLHARNCNQVLGKYLNDPVDAVVCWTKSGNAEGGTATAINLAKEFDIPVFNIQKVSDLKRLQLLLSM